MPCASSSTNRAGHPCTDTGNDELAAAMARRYLAFERLDQAIFGQ
jgi:hypothetical protein